MENEMVSIEVNIEKVPSIVQEQFTKLSELSKKSRSAMEKADSAKKTATEAYYKSTGLFQKKEAIEALQSSTLELANAQIELSEAQEVSFEYQKSLTDVTKYLFALGTSKIAANRSVVRTLQLKMKGATEKELDEFARQELLDVMRQLKAQEDIMQKQEEFGKKAKKQAEDITGIQEQNSEQEKKLLALKQADERIVTELQTAVVSLKKQVKYAYIAAGGTFGLALLELLIILTKLM